jgi:hypothetical protein
MDGKVLSTCVSVYVRSFYLIGLTIYALKTRQISTVLRAVFSDFLTPKLQVFGSWKSSRGKRV